MELRYKEDSDNWEVTVSPGEALLLMSYLANKLVCSQMIPIKFMTTQFKPSQPIAAMLDATTIEELHLRKDHIIVLEQNNIKCLSDLVSKTERELLACKGIKLSRIEIYERALAKIGLRLRGRNRFVDPPSPIPGDVSDNDLRHSMPFLRLPRHR
jgi:hypothetical protein